MADDIQVDIRVTSGLHPQNVKNIEGVGWDDETAMLLEPTYRAFEEVYRGIASVHDAREAAKRNPTLNEASQVIATQDFADKVFAKVAKAMDVTADNLKKGIDGIEKELTKPIEAQGSQSISAEIRAHFKGLKPEERNVLLRNAINGGDHRTATAVLGGPSYLSGFTDDMHVLHLRSYHEKAYPQLAKRLKVFRGAFELLGDRSGLLFTQIERAVGMPPHKVKALREAKLEAERVLKSA
jgi:hypothetical protein